MRDFMFGLIGFVLLIVGASIFARGYDAAQHCEEHGGVAVWRAFTLYEIVCFPNRQTWYNGSTFEERDTIHAQRWGTTKTPPRKRTEKK